MTNVKAVFQKKKKEKKSNAAWNTHKFRKLIVDYQFSFAFFLMHLAEH